MSAWMEDSFSIILPTLNEGENILPMMETLDSLYPNASIVVVDDRVSPRADAVSSSAVIAQLSAAALRNSPD